MGKKMSVFDDQHQSMSSWLEKLANDESKNFTSSELKDESVEDIKDKKYDGISTTWNKKTPSIMHESQSDSARHISNRKTESASSDSIEKEARILMMSGVNIEKIETTLNRHYSKQEMSKFASVILPKLECDYGRLGFIYVDSSLVEDCNQLSSILKSSHKIASTAIKNVKKILGL